MNAVREMPRWRSLIRRGAITAAIGALLVIGAGSPLAAQTVRGRLIDESSGEPVGGASVILLDDAGREVGRAVRSSDDGSFRVHASGAGAHRISARRIGYSPATTAEVRLGMGELVTVEIRLARVAQSVASVRVVARSQLPLRDLMSSDGFDLRRTRGIGRFLGTEDMERVIKTYGIEANIGILAELGEAGLRIGAGTMDQIFRLEPNCAPHVYLDGFRVTSGGNTYGDNAFALVSSIPVSEIYGVEVYKKQEIPPLNLTGMFGTEPPMDSKGLVLEGIATTDGYTLPPNTCGVIAVWTRTRMRMAESRPGKLEPALRGVLLHSVTEKPIVGAVVLLQTERGSSLRPPMTTDSLGRFTIRIPTPGRFRLRAAHSQHDPVTTPPFVADTGQTIIVELRMATEGQPRAPLTIQERVRGGIAPPPDR